MMRFRRCLTRVLVPLLLLGIVAGALAFPPGGDNTAHAQDPEEEEQFVDLEVRLVGNDDTSGNIDIFLANLGNLAAYDVEVILERTRHLETLWKLNTHPPGTVTSLATDEALVFNDTFGRGFKLVIPEVSSQTEYRVRIRGASIPNKVFDFTATITANGSHESYNRLGNNNSQLWYVFDVGGNGGAPAQPNHSLKAWVDNPDPSSGETVHFTVQISRPPAVGQVTYFAQGCVNIRLTSGLTAGTATIDPATDRSFATSTTRDCGDATGATGFLLLPDLHLDRTTTMTLPVTVGDNATVSEQCLTAELFAIPPTGAGVLLDNPYDNRAEYCFGSPPLEVFDEGEVRTWTIFACRDRVPDNECDTAEEVDVRVHAAVLVEEGEHGDPDVIRALDVTTALIHVKDVPGRVFDAHADSVTDGTTVSWQTATAEHMDCTGTRAGVSTGLYTAQVNDYIDNWTNYVPTYTVSGLSGGDPPGNTLVRSDGDCAAYFTMTSATSFTSELSFPLPLNAVSQEPLMLFLEFDDLGTYVVDFEAAMKHASIDDDTDNETDTFSGTGRTSFHVGPIAELGVGDGGPSADVAADRVAFTVAGYNDTGDTYESGKIVVELPAGTTGLTTVPDNTGVFDANVSPPTWTWDIHDLEQTGDIRRSNGKTAGIIVTLIVDGVAAGETATASVEYDPYEVCIANDGSTLAHTNHADCKDDSATTNVWYTAVCVNTADDEVDTTYTTDATCDAETDRTWTDNVCASSDGDVQSGASETACDGWYSGTVFDTNRKNNTATLTARAGGNLPGTPTLKTPAIYTTAAGLEWDEIELIHGMAVSDYEVQWSTDGVNGWTQLDSDLPFPELLDLTIQSGVTRHYRVRAVNEAGVGGPWSAPVAAMTIDTNVPGITISEKTLTIREGESAEYTVTLHARPHSNVSVRINGGGVVAPNPSTLTFNTIDFNMPKTVELTGIQDNNPNNEQVNVTHTISSGDAGYRSLTPDPVAVTVIDDDSGVSVSADRTSVNEGEDIAFTLTRTGNIDSAITVGLSVSQRGSVLPSNQPGARSVNIGANVATATVTVQTDNDTVLENTGSVTVALNSGTGYLVGTPRTATVNVQDDDGPPGQPVNLIAQEIKGAVILYWNAAPSPSSPIEYYSFRMRRTNGGSWTQWENIGDVGLYEAPDLDNGVEYTFQVRARNGTGDGVPAEVTANPRTTPAPPDVTITARHQSLEATWNVTHDGGRDITEYQVQWKSGGESFDSSRQATTATREYTIPNLTNGTDYQVRVRGMNEVGWSEWSSEQPGKPAARPATSVSITTNARDGVSEPFRVTFTFTDEDHQGNRYGVTGFDVDDIEVSYQSTPGYEFSLKDFREEVTGFRYSARVEDILEGTLNISVKAGAAKSTHSDEQRSAAATHSIEVKVPETVAPTGTQIWAAEMTVGEIVGNAVGYIDRDLSVWQGTGKTGSLSDGDTATDDDEQFTYARKDYTVGEVSFVPAWSSILFSVCPGIEGVNSAFDLYLDDLVDGQRDLTLNFDKDEVRTSNFNGTIGGVSVSCVEYQWKPRRVDWEENGKVNVRLVR